MVFFKQGDLFKSPAEAYVNTVNTYGVMGKGIALEFKKRFPKNYGQYRAYCDNRLLRAGSILVHQNVTNNPKWIINLATKDHWRNPSQYHWIRSGLLYLEDFILAEQCYHIAMPALGCSNGQLSFDIVKEIICEWDDDFELNNRTTIEVYEPHDQSSTL